MSLKSQQTLKGVFPQPKVQPKRDFLRENKLKLRDLQKHVINRKQLENEIAEKNSIRLSNSNRTKLKQRYKSLDDREFCRNTNASNLNVKRLNSPCLSCCHGSQQIMCCRNSPIQCCHTVPIEGCQQILSGCNNSNKLIIHNDKEIQTDDIDDEDYLRNALQRCSSRQLIDLDNNSIVQSTKLLPSHNCDSNQNHYSTSLQLTNRSQFDKHTQQNYEIHSNHPDCDSDRWNVNFENLKLNNDRPMTNQTNQSTTISNQHTKRKSTKLLGAPDFSNRADIRLPKYLEKQIRERKEQKIRDMEKDPNCPEGHHLLGETEKINALKDAEKKFQDLISELNRMPMTSETLRTRQRKNEIEKELVELEHNIRDFSKQKLYVKGNE